MGGAEDYSRRVTCQWWRGNNQASPVPSGPGFFAVSGAMGHRRWGELLIADLMSFNPTKTEPTH